MIAVEGAIRKAVAEGFCRRSNLPEGSMGEELL